MHRTTRNPSPAYAVFVLSSTSRGVARTKSRKTSTLRLVTSFAARSLALGDGDGRAARLPASQPPPRPARRDPGVVDAGAHFSPVTTKVLAEPVRLPHPDPRTARLVHDV